MGSKRSLSLAGPSLEKSRMCLRMLGKPFHSVTYIAHFHHGYNSANRKHLHLHHRFFLFDIKPFLSAGSNWCLILRFWLVGEPELRICLPNLTLPCLACCYHVFHLIYTQLTYLPPTLSSRYREVPDAQEVYVASSYATDISVIIDITQRLEATERPVPSTPETEDEAAVREHFEDTIDLNREGKVLECYKLDEAKRRVLFGERFP